MYHPEPDYDGAGSYGDNRSLSAYGSQRGSFRRHSYTGTADTAFVNSAVGGLERRWSNEVLSTRRSATEVEASSSEEEEEDLEEESPEPLRIPRVRASHHATAAHPVCSEGIAQPSAAAAEGRQSCVCLLRQIKGQFLDREVPVLQELHPFAIVGKNWLRLTVRRTKPLLGLVIEGGCNTTQLTPRIVGIHPEGAAQETGVLRPGQALLEVQGVPTQRLTHAHVARLLADAYYSGDGGSGVTMVVTPLEPSRRFSFIWDTEA